MPSSLRFVQAAVERRIQEEVDSIASKHPDFEQLLKRLSRSGPIVVFGGFVRDIIHSYVHRAETQPRDIDIVVDGVFEIGTEDSLNNFGGQRFRLNESLKADFWELRRTYAFRRGLFEPSLSNLLLTTVYTVNACFFDLRELRLIEHGAVRDITRKVISFNCTGYLDAFPQYQAFRAVDLAQRLGYALESNVLAFVTMQMRRCTFAEFVRAVQQHRPEMGAPQIEMICRPYAGEAGWG